MATTSKSCWDQVKSVTADELISALKRDGFEKDAASKGAIIMFIKMGAVSNRRVGIHYHPKKTYGAKTLKEILASAGWAEDSDLKRVKLAK